MRQRRGEKLGCCQLAVIAFAMLVVFQFGVLALRIVHEMIVLAGTLVKWAGLGLAGALGLAALVAILYGVSKGFGGIVGAFRNWQQRRVQEREARYAHYQRACEWQHGIAKTVHRLRRRGWLSKGDARRYRDIADIAVKRLRTLDEDLNTLRRVSAAYHWIETVESGAQTILSRLERVHNSLVRLLAESAVRPVPSVEVDLQEAADELDALLAALEDVEATSGVDEALMSEAATWQNSEEASAAGSREVGAERPRHTDRLERWKTTR